MTDEEMINGTAAGAQVERLKAIMHRLRAPGGCPWDAEQSHESIVPNLIEEAYETVDAIQRADDTDMTEELGDLLLQVVFHCEIAEEQKRFDLEDARVEARRSRTEADTQTEPGPRISRADISPESRAQLRMIGMRNIGEG